MGSLITVGVLVGVVLVGGSLWVRARREVHRLERQAREAWRRRSPTELVDGEVTRVVGTARRTDGDLEAPLSGRRVLAFVATVDGVYEWPFDRLLVSAQDVVAFDLELGMGRVHVRGGAHRLGLERTRWAERFGTGPSSSRLVAFVRKCGGNTHTIFGLPRRLRWLERTLEDGDQVVVVGLVRREPLSDGATDYRSGAAEVHIVAPPDDRVTLGSAWLS